MGANVRNDDFFDPDAFLGAEVRLRHERAPDYGGGLGGPLAAMAPPTKPGGHTVTSRTTRVGSTTTDKPSEEEKKKSGMRWGGSRNPGYKVCFAGEKGGGKTCRTKRSARK